MNNLGTKTLDTERLTLRRFTMEDAQYMFDNWASDCEVTKFLVWPTHSSIEISKEYIQYLIAEYAKPDIYNWGIELKEIGQVVGAISAVRCNEEVGYVHIGYCIGKPWWNKGITSEAFATVIKFFMDEVQVNRIESRHDPRNHNSGEVMKKCGLIYEGTLRQSDVNNQGICDALWYALLRDDYYAKRNTKLVT